MMRNKLATKFLSKEEQKKNTDQQKANTKPKPQKKLRTMCMFHLSEINYASRKKIYGLSIFKSAK